MSYYASRTRVSAGQTRMEIERLLEKHGAKRKATMTEPGRAIVYFEMAERHIRFEVRMPQDGGSRDASQEANSLWRALLLAIKAKLVSVESGVETFEQAFLAQIMMPGGQTLGEMASPVILEAYRTGKVKDGFLLGSGSHG